MIFDKETKYRLSIENASIETRRVLEKKLSDVKKSRTTATPIYSTVLSDLLHGIHVLSQSDVADNDYCGAIRNNYIEALALEFPDLVLKEKE